MSWNALLGAACTLSFLLPVIVVLYDRLYTHKSLIPLMLYFFIAVTSNIVTENYLPLSRSVEVFYGRFGNYLDVPLMLTSLLFFSPTRIERRFLRALIYAFIGFELTVSIFHGFSQLSGTYILGPGFVLVLLVGSYLFPRQVKFSIMHRKNPGRMMMLAAVLFLYATYLLVYYFYYIQRTPYKNDVLCIYYISSSLASVLMAAGLHRLRQRIKELQSLRTTRRELELFFNQP